MGSPPTGWQLATELKRLRLAAEMTIEQVAEHLEWSPAQIPKIENARVSVLPQDVRHLLDAYGIGEGPERPNYSAIGPWRSHPLDTRSAWS